MAGVLNGRFDIPGPANTQHTLVVDMDTLVMAQFVVDPAVTLIRALCMDTLDLLCQRLVLGCSAAELA